MEGRWKWADVLAHPFIFLLSALLANTCADVPFHGPGNSLLLAVPFHPFEDQLSEHTKESGA